VQGKVPAHVETIYPVIHNESVASTFAIPKLGLEQKFAAFPSRRVVIVGALEFNVTETKSGDCMVSNSFQKLFGFLSNRNTTDST
jgi:hypothetical protein